MSSSLIIILFIIAGFYLINKYQQVQKKPKVISKLELPELKKPSRNNYMANRDIIPYMTYSAGPFDESIWRYPDQGGKTITSQCARPRPF